MIVVARGLKEGIGGSYRIPSLDRLAYKQRLLEQNGGLGLTERSTNGHPTQPTLSSASSSGAGSTDTVHITTSSLVSKHAMRERRGGKADGKFYGVCLTREAQCN